MNLPFSSLPLSLLLAGSLFAGAARADTGVYRCPGNNFTNSITAKEAQAKGCKPVEGGNVTVVASPKRTMPPASSAPRASDSKVNPADQKARDSDSRRILEDELRKEEEQLAALQKEYSNGEPERLGGERNYQKYLDRTANLKAAIERTQSDIDALRRELAKYPQ